MSLTSASIVLDSQNQTGDRLTTFELRYPRIVHAELLTHKKLSRSTASSRAIPNIKLRELVEKQPFVPSEWGSNQRGMQAGEPLPSDKAGDALKIWLAARDNMLHFSQGLAELGVHKQLANRLLEPFQYITVIVSATSYTNWFALRTHSDAQPQIQELALAMWDAYKASRPTFMQPGEWHLPLYSPATDYEPMVKWYLDEQKTAPLQNYICAISAGRCARVSYLSHHGDRHVSEDISLCERLAAAGHFSPFEHVAQALPGPYQSGNFTGWHQLRKGMANEHIDTFEGPSKAA